MIILDPIGSAQRPASAAWRVSRGRVARRLAGEPRPARIGAPVSHVSCMRSLGFASLRQPRKKYDRLNVCRRRLARELNSTRRRLCGLARQGPAASHNSQRRRSQTRFLAGSGASTPTSGPRRLTLEHAICCATTLRLERRSAGPR